tara:strand:- start:812 stop:1663 length:852 start_codon:yes stop_codon:yes gene_type:complete
MKIKSTLSVILFSIIFFTSCQDESIKCDGYLEQKTVISILKDEILKEKSTIKYSLGIDEEYLDKFFENNLKLSLIRTTAKDKELKSCECSAQLGLKLKQEIIDFTINSAKGTGIDLEYAKERLSNMINMKADIEYSLQETSDDNFIAETTIPYKEIGALLSASFLFETNYNKREFELKKDKIYRFVSGSEDCSYDIWLILSPRNNEVKGEYTQKCYNSKEPNIKKISGIFENGTIKGNLENKEFFEIKFNELNMEYYLLKMILDDGEIMTFEENSPMIYTLKE